MLLVVMMVGLTGCGSNKGVKYKNYVESLITANYLGVSSEYVQTTGINEADAEAMYLQNMERLAGSLEQFYDFDISSDIELSPRMTELAKKIYSKTRFEVQDAYKENEIYYVNVTVYPIDILNQAHPDVVACVEDFNQRVKNGEFNDYEKDEYERVFASSIIEILEKASDSMTYKDPVEVKVRIITTDSSFYIKNEDFRTIDAAILATKID